MSTADWDKSVTSLAFTTILFPSILSTVPFLFATIVTPESNATSDSMPVPTNGDSGFNKGTAWRIMFEPIKALLASSFSKKGIKAAATETNCFGETSIKSILSLLDNSKFKFFLHATNSSLNEPSLFNAELAWAIVNFSSSMADKYFISAVTFPLTIFL